ncbi:MAG: hypothetical protein PHD04_00935 [Candidatus Pacebacteria bacterium]|nr:hypothetical protein [Candidatus Paceibacterota bacterium]
MTPYELKYNVEQTDSYFFTRGTMKFFGDTMKNYGCRSAVVNTYTRNSVDVWELYRRRPVKGGLQTSAYFRKDNFKRIHVKEE